MKILVVCQYYYPEPVRITDICESLVKRGHEVTVLTGLPNYPEGKVLSDYKKREKRNEIINGVKVIRTFEVGRGKTNSKRFLNYISFMLSGTIKASTIKDDYDVVLVNQLSPIMMALPAIIYKKRKKKKMYLYCLDLWPESLMAGGIQKNSLIYKVFLMFSKYIYSSADKIMVSSHSFIDYFKNVLKDNKASYDYLPQYAEDLFTNLKVKEASEEKNFVFAGNIGDMQSIETIIFAAELLKDEVNIKFHLVGNGSKLDEAIELSNSLQLKNVIFHGRKPLSEMPKYYSMADAMLVTLKDNEVISYTLPGKVQTYMAAKKPIIGAINGETKFIIEKANCGLCCKAEDYKGLADTIKKFCTIKNIDSLGENGFKYYEENFSKEKFINNLEVILKTEEY